MSSLLVERDQLVLLREAWTTLRDLARDGHISERDADRLCAEAFQAWVEANRKDAA